MIRRQFQTNISVNKLDNDQENHTLSNKKNQTDKGNFEKMANFSNYNSKILI